MPVVCAGLPHGKTKKNDKSQEKIINKHQILSGQIYKIPSI